MLETLREFADALLTSAERDALEDRHEAYWAETACCASDGGVEIPWGELDNVLKAYARSRAREDGVEHELLLLTGLLWVWRQRGWVRVGRDALEHALGRDDARRARSIPGIAGHGRRGLLLAAGWFLSEVDRETARIYGEEAVQASRESGDVPAVIRGLSLLGFLCQRRGDADGERKLQEEISRLTAPTGEGGLRNAPPTEPEPPTDPVLYRKVLEDGIRAYLENGQEEQAANALCHLAGMEYHEGNFAAAAARASESAALSRRRQDWMHTFFALGVLCPAQAWLGDGDGAAATLAEMRAIVADFDGVAPHIYRLLANAAFESFQFAPAHELYRDCLRRAVESSHGYRVPFLLGRLSVAAERLGDLQEAVRLLGAAYAWSEGVEECVPPFEADGEEAARRDALRAAAGSESAFKNLWESGRRLDAEALLVLARTVLRAVPAAADTPRSGQNGEETASKGV
jgi:hypothetical protein